MEIRDDLRYTDEHEWLLAEADNRVRIGITDYAQDALGDVVYVELPDTGREVSAGETIAEVESTKSVADIYAPLAGTVVEANAALGENPELVNQDPYGKGWFAVIEVAAGIEPTGLLDAAAYRALTE
jgi:glycine cleavage system H protein